MLRGYLRLHESKTTTSWKWVYLLAHLEAQRVAYSENLDVALSLEDDAKVEGDFEARVSEFVSRLSRNSGAWRAQGFSASEVADLLSSASFARLDLPTIGTVGFF
jgi:hypothetical protein